MSETTIIGIVLFCLGLFSIFCSAMNFDWFFEHRKAAKFVEIFGRSGTRVFYIVLGVLMIFFAIIMFVVN